MDGGSHDKLELTICLKYQRRKHEHSFTTKIHGWWCCPLLCKGESLEAPYEEHEETTKQDNVVTTLTITDPEHVPMQTPTLV